MDRIKEIVNYAKSYQGKGMDIEELKDIIKLAIIDGALWADKTMLDKVCRFIKELCRVCDITDENGYVVDYNRIEVELRKQMKGE